MVVVVELLEHLRGLLAEQMVPLAVGLDLMELVEMATLQLHLQVKEIMAEQDLLLRLIMAAVAAVAQALLVNLELQTKAVMAALDQRHLFLACLLLMLAAAVAGFTIPLQLV